MNQEPEKKSENSPLDTALLVIVGVVMAAVLMRFLVFVFSDGWSVASEKVPAGKVLTYVFLGITFLLSGPWLMDHGHRAIGKVMVWVAVAVVGFTLLAAIPSCNDDRYSDQPDLPYRR